MSPSQDRAVGADWLRKQTRQIETHSGTEVSEQVAEATKVEQWLQKRGVAYAPATAIPMDMIDERRSRQNQARRDPLVVESVERFAAAYKQGAMFPPIVVYAQGNKLIIIDGNNRQAAAKRANREYIWGIIISEQTPGEMIQLLTVEANASHGVTPELPWRIKQAFHLISVGHNDAVAAEASAISLTQLRNARAAHEAEVRARTLRIYGFDDLSNSTKLALNAIKDEPVFHAAGKLAASQKFGVELAKDLVRRVKAGKSEAERLEAVAQMAKDMDVETARKKVEKKGVSAPKQALVAGVGLVLKCDPLALVNQIVTAHDRDVINRRLAEAVEKILEIQIAMESVRVEE
jgi:hypothetical protein